MTKSTSMSKKLVTAIFIFFCLCSCSKKDDPSPQPGGGKGYGVSGSVMFNWATEGILKIDLATGVRSTVLPENTSRYGWDISRDGKKILQSTEDPDDLDANIYTYSDISSGAIVSQFKYYPDGTTDITNGYLSPDETMVAIQPDFDYGIVILDMHGKELYNLTGFAGQKFGHSTQIVWMPDNSLLFTIDQSIYRTNTDFTKATLIKTLNFESWGDLSVSPDGKKIAFDGGNHIWMMNSDGSNLVQVTDSDDQEKNSAFSPDGKYLLVGTDWHVTGPFGSIWYLAIIPADGQKYNVNKEADKRVIFIKDSESSNGGQACDGYMYWR
jgi:Tol biopolymer transport system component